MDDAYQIVDFRKPADIAVINTCTVTQKGDTDARRLIHKANRLNPDVSIALIGCQAEIQKNLLTNFQNVRWVVGNAKKIDLLSIIKNTRLNEPPLVITPQIPTGNFTIPITGIDEKRTRANLKIQDGCNFFCSFCEIPYARGRARSRDFQNILEEAKYLAEIGHKELIITGINVGTYRQNNHSLFDVILALEDIKKIERIRISSIEFTTIDKRILTHMAQSPKLCRHLHVPLQSADDQVLKSMNRKYTYKAFDDFIDFAYNTVKNICLGTDLIVGFPTETDIRFQKTYNHMKNSHFHYFHVFSYSRRNVAKSKKLSQTIPISVIQKRSLLLRKLSTVKRKEYYSSFIGTTQKVLFEQKKGESWTGLTDNYVRVSANCKRSLRNQIREVQCVSLENDKILGTIKRQLRKTHGKTRTK